MVRPGSNEIITDGTDQKGREPAAFRPDYFNVDEMNFETLLSIATRYASTINYYNSDNQQDGHWGEMFFADEAVILALIATCDERQIERDFLRIDRASLADVAEYVIQIAARLDFWLQRLTQVSTTSASQLRHHMHEMISTRLLAGFHTAAAIMLHERDRGDEAYSLDRFSAVWAVQCDDEEFGLRDVNGDLLTDRDAAFSLLEDGLLRIVAVVRNLKLLVGDAMQVSLRSQTHEPTIGLYMVFLHLYRVAQQRLNRFTMRHLDFYYRDVLGGSPRKRQEESLFLKFKAVAARTALLVGREIAFSADKQHSEGVRAYHLKAPLMVRDAKVCELRTLYFQRSRLISPECELGHVTRARSRQRRLTSDSDADVIESMPLFGSERSGVRTPGSRDAEIGFAIASPILALKEGRREIELVIDFALPDSGQINAAFTGEHQFDSPDQFATWFGRIFSYYLLSGKAFLSTARRAKLLSLAEKYGGGNDTYRTLLTESWQDLFYRLFKRPFAITLSGVNGWLPVNEYLVSPAIEDDYGINSGLKVKLSLGHNVESIIACDTELHGEQCGSELPVLNLGLNPEASFYAYSLLNSVDVNSVEVEVVVSGVRELAISNQLGRIDPAKPFAPFGPLPSRNSFLVIGSREAAEKEVTAMSLALEWGELPIESGGFTTHYEGYQAVPFNSSFKAEISVLQDGNWMPSKSEAQYRVALFESGRDGVVTPHSLLKVDAVDHLKPAVSDERFEFRAASRNGYVRLQLAAPDNAFGHSDYPRLLTQILTENARRKRPLPVPNPPYTPILRAVSLNYRARCRVTPGGDIAQSKQQRERLIHRHPFGNEVRYPAASRNRMSLFPRYTEDGTLFIGIETSQLVGYLSLFFDLDEEATHLTRSTVPRLQWRCLTHNGWQLLEKRRTLSDSTEGFVRSGVVALDLPQGLVNDSPLMPSGQFWLSVSTSDELQTFSGLRSVVANVGEIVCDGLGERDKPAVIEESWRAVKSLPGLASVSRIGGSRGGRSAESDAQFRTRLSERLRHKGRASTPWDYERLILERFPEIYKVKCFSNTRSDTGSDRANAAPGNITIVVVPHMGNDNDSRCERGLVNRAELLRVQRYVRQLTSPFVRIEVRNPIYEQIQVRCTVKFVGELSGGGLYIKRLNRAINNYLSPWCDVGYGAKFGWMIRSDDIESYIRELDYVEFVTNFSMLHITAQHADNYTLMDTARLDSRHEALITPRYPWSLALPMRNHFIETSSTIETIEPEVTGINELEVGSTFIIGGN